MLSLVELQQELVGHGLLGETTGVLDATTMDAVRAFLLAGSVPESAFSAWGQDQRKAAAAQIVYRNAGIPTGAIDGLVGPQTRYADSVWRARRAGRETEETTWRDMLPAESEQASIWPKQNAMAAFYGAVGTNQVTLRAPYPMRIAWDPRKRVEQFPCHAKVRDSAQRVLARVRDHYGYETVRDLGLDFFGGCLNVRRMRGGSAWSTHAWGAAIDFDPERNQLRWNRSRAAFAQSVYNRWWELWEEEGWVSLGRTCDFDWMHVQAARL